VNFYDQQDRARAQTRLLVALFTLAIIVILAATYLTINTALLIFVPVSRSDGSVPLEWDLGVFGVASMFVLVVVGGAMWSKHRELKTGGASVALRLGGRLLSPEDSDPKEQQLLNIVEEMALASGIPVPLTFVLPTERGINAFAAGHSIADAAVAVTGGALDVLNRDEMQGVIGHEFSHILNGDMKISIRMIAVLHGLQAIGHTGTWLMSAGSRGNRGPSRRSNDVAPVFVIIGMLLVAFGYLGVVLGRLIRGAVSRQREYLADAAATQFTRNPRGLASALKKIGGLEVGSRVDTRGADEISHLFFGAAFERASWFSTHPPLVDRIRRLDPAFPGVFPRVEMTPEQEKRGSRLAHDLQADLANVGTSAFFAPIEPLESANLATTPVLPEHAFTPFTAIADALHNIPSMLHDAAYTPFGAVAIVSALALDERPHIREDQARVTARHLPAHIAEEAINMRAKIEALPPETRMPLLELCATGLRKLSPKQAAAVRACLSELASADESLDIFEFTLLKCVDTWLDPQPYRAHEIRFTSVRFLSPMIGSVLAMFAITGGTDENERSHAYKKAVASLPKAYAVQPDLPSQDEVSVDALEVAIYHLKHAPVVVRENVLRACRQAIEADGVVVRGEFELLRAVATALGVPAPPLEIEQHPSSQTSG